MGPREYKPVSIGGFVIDAAISETHTRTAKVTRYPVESGSTMTDNVVLDPDSIMLECCVSDTPLEPVLSVRGTDEIRWSDEAYQRIRAMFKAKEPIEVVTPIETYSNMVIENFSVPRRSEDGGALLFSLTLTQVLVVTNERTVVKVALPRSSKKQSLGTKPTVQSGPNATRLEVRERNARAEAARKDKLSWLGSGIDNVLPGNFLTN